MNKDKLHGLLENLLERLAAIEHDRWAHWQRHMHSKGTTQSDGSMLIPADLASRWASQMDTPYSNLTETEKESDREQVRGYLSYIEKAMENLD